MLHAVEQALGRHENACHRAHCMFDTHFPLAFLYQVIIMSSRSRFCGAWSSHNMGVCSLRKRTQKYKHKIKFLDFLWRSSCKPGALRLKIHELFSKSSSVSSTVVLVSIKPNSVFAKRLCKRWNRNDDNDDDETMMKKMMMRAVKRKGKKVEGRTRFPQSVPLYHFAPLRLAGGNPHRKPRW